MPSFKYFNLTYPISYVAHVEINRPEKLNSFIEPYGIPFTSTPPSPYSLAPSLTHTPHSMWQELPPLFTFLSSDPNTRAIILSGAGPRAFTAGLDVNAASKSSPLSPSYFSSSAQSQDPADLPPSDPARIANYLRNHILSFQSCITSIAKCSKPLICALHGYAYGLAIDIASCADVRICTRDTKFSVKEVDIGIAADIGTLTRLVKVVGNDSWVKDVCLSARVFTGEEAGRVGLCSWVGTREKGGVEGDGGKEEMMAEALRWAKVVSAKSPVAVQGTKDILDWSRDRSVEDGLKYTAVWNAAMLQTSDVERAMQAGMKKRKPRFEKL